MDKSGAIAGSALGVILVVMAFAFIVNPPDTIQRPHSISNLPNDIIEVAPYNQDITNDIIEAVPYNQDITNGISRDLSLIEIFERTETGVVRVNVQKTNLEDPRGLGSGFVYNVRGHIITNAHVIDDSKKIVVTFLDGTSYNADIIGKDIFTDIAVIKVEADRSLLHPLTVGDSSKLKVGEQIAAIGNPFGLSGSMTSGIVSQLGRLLPTQGVGFQIPDVIQTDAAINPGNSGGPLLNMRGQVVGINTAIQSTTGEFTGVGFAVPTKTVTKIVPKLIRDGGYHHPWLGISGVDVDPDLADILDINAKGFLIISVVKDSPAEKAGLHGSEDTIEIDGLERAIGGDIITSVDDIEVRKIDDILIHLQREKAVGDDIILGIIRDGRTTSFTLTLEQRPEVPLE